ncbi:hypothetical protein DASC09_026270 [Saccharomycopsis crataegensis]|uniref:Uncharacterized protein n=1 Tax=Saccharomycopsis crataegensis TaxID=43959 RepID=A0AAV5QL78_9ASCO|nr:hypothetical protein DASC09_026270 [Saccharomycopsis crataegensis]
MATGQKLYFSFAIILPFLRRYTIEIDKINPFLKNRFVSSILPNYKRSYNVFDRGVVYKICVV